MILLVAIKSQKLHLHSACWDKVAITSIQVSLTRNVDIIWSNIYIKSYFVYIIFVPINIPIDVILFRGNFMLTKVF
jgi:hypothetical protein